MVVLVMENTDQTTTTCCSSCTCQNDESDLYQKSLSILAPLLSYTEGEGVEEALICLAEKVAQHVADAEQELADEIPFADTTLKVAPIVAELQHIAGFSPNPVCRASLHWEFIGKPKKQNN